MGGLNQNNEISHFVSGEKRQQPKIPIFRTALSKAYKYPPVRSHNRTVKNWTKYWRPYATENGLCSTSSTGKHQKNLQRLGSMFLSHGDEGVVCVLDLVLGRQPVPAGDLHVKLLPGKENER